MDYEENFNRLESVIAKSLERFNELKTRKQAIEDELRDKEREAGELRETVARLKEEKSAVLKRVESLISSIENWEDSRETEQYKSGEETGRENEDPSASPSIFRPTL